MTCIVAVRSEKGVWLGADSAASNGWTISTPDSGHKLFRAHWYGAEGKKHVYLVGGTQTFRSIDLLHYGVPEKLRGSDPPKDGDLRGWLVETFVERLRALYKERDFLKKESEQAAPEVFCILALQGRIFRIQTDLSVLEHESFAAVGSGSNVAYGSLITTRQILQGKPRRRVILALEAAAERVVTVAPPFRVLRMKA